MKVFIVWSIIICGLTKSVQNNNIDCDSSLLQLRTQCNCTIADTANNICKWNSRKIIFNKTPQEGFIDFQLPNLAECESREYEIKLYINENMTREICNQYSNKNVVLDGQHWKVHSKFTYKVYELQNCKFCTNTNNSISTATFEYLFSGCYVFNINNKILSLYESYPTFITTGYKKRLFDNNIVKVQQPRFTENKELEITIDIDSKHFVKLPSIETRLIEKLCEENCSELRAITQINSVDKDLTKYNETFASCSNVSNVTQNCLYTEGFNSKLYECKYTGLKPGNYSFRFTFLDEYTRCNDYSLWELCDWPVSSISVPREKPKNTTSFIPTEDTNLPYIIVPTSIVIIFFLCSSIFLTKKYRRFKSKDTFTLKPIYGGPETLPLKPQEILIIYARDSEIFKKMITSFRLLLSSTDNEVFIHDIHLDNESICMDPQTWILHKISNENMKVILFLNNCGLVFYENHPKIAYRISNWHDPLFMYAIKQLKSSDTRNYTNLFVVEMAGIFYSTSAFDDLNPETRYLMPNNIEKLLESIFPNRHNYNKSFLQNFTRYCEKYNTFCKENPGYVKNVLEIG